MIVQDPVCGMQFDDTHAAARAEHEGVTFSFCSARCQAQFARDPGRFVGTDSAAAGTRKPLARARSPRFRPGRRCPYCGERTVVAGGVGPKIGGLGMQEIGVIMRGEWRRRLGPDAYARRHSLEMICGLLAYALQPGSAQASSEADQLLAKELARWREQGLSLDLIWQELTELSRAAWDILSRSRASLEMIVPVMARIDDKLMSALETDLAAAGRAERLRSSGRAPTPASTPATPQADGPASPAIHEDWARP